MSRWLLQPSALIGLIALALVIAAACAAPWLFPDDPMNMVAEPYLWPGQDAQFPLGTDLMGRDLLAGLLHGARVSLLVGVASTLIALVIGIVVGVLAGFYRGWVDKVLTGVTTLFQTIPAFLLAIILVAVLQPSIGTIIFALGITSWTSIARLVRTEFLSLRQREFVRASISLGASDMHLIFREILPNAWTPVVVSTALLIANAILSEAGLSFLGLGDPNVVSWGSMIGTGRDALRTGWYMTAIPGVAIMLTVMALNLLSDALHTALNPRLRRRRSLFSVL
ncbi:MULTISPECIES: ABC transporter permease [unclassified Brenneria]|uniref:ABC transporter permease n=1 Tax=unclassified Brenneria TaxID=2634434 RepID=UPI0029C53720|nr:MULTISPECIES: ABC transporter permease [unclassified Brenneria]MDX5629978.1 ABC transporter permease [Brenneria sp. L3-3Z]MDX5697124.1 ABC transporter permease [Brenneria sp. L4-2C]MEE3664627.1 ABC transporter permease [Brenneria sp. g21c3]